MGRLIDYNDVYNAIQITTDNFGVAKRVVEDNMLEMLSKIETAEAISKAEIKKFLEEGIKDVNNNVLAIVREDYIHKSDYENRLKADMVAMLKELEKELKEVKCNYLATIHDDIAEEYFNLGKIKGLYLIQQKINELKAKSEEQL